jgi:hypothetical protein
MACAICKTRRPRRFCPGVRGDICAICCGTEREVTVDCPLDCEYLAEAHRRERPPELEGVEVPHRDVQITERLLAENEPLLIAISTALLQTALSTPGVVDFDARDALDSLARTYKTLQSGVYYESRPANPLAATIYSAMQKAAADFRAEEHRRVGMTRTLDSHVLAILVFLQRFEMERNNGRRRGRAFIDSLRQVYPESRPAESPVRSSLILP